MKEKNWRKLKSLQIYSLSARSVDQKCNQCGRGWTHAVQSQHGILELFFTHHMI